MRGCRIQNTLHSCDPDSGASDLIDVVRLVTNTERDYTKFYFCSFREVMRCGSAQFDIVRVTEGRNGLFWWRFLQGIPLGNEALHSEAIGENFDDQ